MRSFPTAFGLIVIVVLLLVAIQVDANTYELTGWLP